MSKFVYDYAKEVKYRKKTHGRKRKLKHVKKAALLIILLIAVAASGYLLYTGNVISFDNKFIANQGQPSQTPAANQNPAPTDDTKFVLPDGNYTSTSKDIDEEYVNGFLVKYQEYPGASCSGETDNCISYIASKMGMSEEWVVNLYYLRCIDSTCYAKPQRILNRQ